MTGPSHQNELLQVVAYLNAAVSNRRLYAAEHPQVARYLERAYEAIKQVLAGKPELTFIIVDNEVVVDNRTLSSKTPHLKQFASNLLNNAIERITFTANVTLAELAILTGDLADAEKEVVRSSAGIILGKIQMERATSRVDAISPEARQKMKELGLLDGKPLDEMKEVLLQARAMKQIPMTGLKEIVHGFISGMLYNIQPLDLLASLKTSDEYTFTHAINVCILTMAQAECLGLNSGKLYEVGVAAAMHDVGKMFVPDEVLNKPGKLTDEEWELMRHHTIRGARYILKTDGLPRLAFIAALEHHIRYDGSGYPELQKGWKPNIVSQMIAVADLFDAMRSRRPYQDPRPDEQIVKILTEESGTALNPVLVENFIHLIHPESASKTKSAKSQGDRT
jgi:HD-GYP domain-containing protein (c-di-GMP phosphodiesterase class II)